MAKGEGAESGSAAGLLPTGILQAGERPVQVKVRARHRVGWRGRLIWGSRGINLVLGHLGPARNRRTQRQEGALGCPGWGAGAGSDGEGLQAAALFLTTPALAKSEERPRRLLHVCRALPSQFAYLCDE